MTYESEIANIDARYLRGDLSATEYDRIYGNINERYGRGKMRQRRIWQDGNEVVLLDPCPFDTCETERRFWVPPSGGYVREVSEKRPGTLGGQVCEYLYSRGYTISASPDLLLDVIRREYRARAQREKRNREQNDDMIG